MKELEQSRHEDDENAIYSLMAVVKLVFSLQTKALADYQKAIKDIKTTEEYLSLLETFINRYEWLYTNGASDTPADKKDAIGIFDIRFMKLKEPARMFLEKPSERLRHSQKTKKNIQAIRELRQKLSGDLKEILKPALEKCPTYLKMSKMK
jgi:hypothetical protein